MAPSVAAVVALAEVPASHMQMIDSSQVEAEGASQNCLTEAVVAAAAGVVVDGTMGHTKVEKVEAEGMTLGAGGELGNTEVVEEMQGSRQVVVHNSVVEVREVRCMSIVAAEGVEAEKRQC